MGQLVSQEIPNLVGGVSQQAPDLRAPNQCEEQVNCWNSMVAGLSPRSGTKRQGISGVNAKDAYIMDYHRDDSEHYRVVLNDDGGQKLRVYDGDNGREYPVVVSDGLDKNLDVTPDNFTDVPYLNPVGDHTHREAFQLLPVKDSVLILNRTFPTKRVIGDSDDDAEPTITEFRRYKLSVNYLDAESYVYYKVFRGDPSYAYYRYTINGEDFEYEWTASAVEVATRLATQISAALPDIDAGVEGSSVYITIGPDQALDIADNSIVKAAEAWTNTYGEWHPSTLTISTEKLEVVTGVTGRPNFEALLWVRQADYAVNYNVIVNGTTYNHKTPESTSTAARDGLRTESIAASIALEVQNEAGVTAVSDGNVVHMSSAEDFDLKANDSLGGIALVAFKRSVMNEADLPGGNAPDGYKVQIRGNLEAPGTNGYWLKYDRSDGSQGIWVETTSLASENRFDLSTMPLSLQRKQDFDKVTGANPLGIFFELTTTPWNDRLVGDDDSAPFPHFMSEQSMEDATITYPRTITAMGLYQNRLVLASGDTMTISEVGYFFNLFPTTVATTVGSDPMEVALDTNDVVSIKHVTPGIGSLILWTDRKQYALQQSEVFTASSIRSRMVTADEADLSIEPLAVGNRVYFAVERGQHKAIKELYPVGQGQLATEDVTAHVPEYIKGDIIKMVGNTAINSLFLLTSEYRGGRYSNTVYVYNYFNKGNERVQSAWSKWEFNGNVVDLSVNNTRLSFLIEHKIGEDVDGEPIYETYLEVMELAFDELEQFHGHGVFIDSYEHRDTEWLPEEVNPGEITKKLDGRFYKGYPINTLYEFSPFSVRDRDGSAYTSGRLQLKRLILSYYDTTNFVFEVETLARETRTRLFQGRVLGRLDNILGKVPVVEGRYSAPIMGRSGAVKVRIRNNEIFGFKFQSATWEGFFNQRSKRL